MKKYVLLVVLFGVLSCTSDSEIEDTPPIEVQLLKNIYLNNNLLYSYEYFTDGNIQTQIAYTNGAISSFTSYEYSNDTVYKNTSGFFNMKTKSYLENSQTIRLLKLDESDNLLFSHLSIYSSEDCRLSKIETYTQSNNLYTITEYDYIDSNCSFNSNRELFNGTLKNKFRITNDNKNNYKKSLNPWISFAKKHNIIEYRKWDSNDNLILNSSYNSEFIYDDNKYPIQEIKTTLEGDIKVFTYEYY